MRHQADPRISASVLEALIKAGLILLLVLFCYQVLAPFMALMLWALVLAITLYPAHQRLTARIGNRSGLAATLIVLFGILLLVVPSGFLLSSVADTVTPLISKMQSHSLQIPPPQEQVSSWPVIGPKLYALWQQAASDLPGLLGSVGPELAGFAKKVMGFAASMGGGMFMFLFAFLISGVMMAYGKAGAASMEQIAKRLAGQVRGVSFIRLSNSTIRAVAMGILGVALIQSIAIGLIMMLAGIPLAGIWALLVLVLGIAQLPIALITLPAILWLWLGTDYSPLFAGLYSALLFVGGLIDNVLKPIMLGRGVEAPMPVVLLGALGGMVSNGILGMFLGATMLALGYQLFMGWVKSQQPPVETPDTTASP
jgi:predicted PurR-regulated permease PerM